MATGDVFLGGIGDDAPELPLAGTTRGKQLHVGETLLHFPGIEVPVCLSEVGESVVRGFWEVHRKGSSQLDEDGEVVGVQSDESGPL